MATDEAATDEPLADEAAAEGPVKKKRNSAATKARILAAAQVEFARSGLRGARTASIATRSDSNKRMIYEYFGSKEGLFEAVIESAWADIRAAEQRLHLTDLEPMEAMRTLTRFTWSYYLKNPHFIALVNSENLHRAVHLKKMKARIGEMQQHMVEMISEILARGVASGTFREGVDPVQLAITIAAINYYYLSNKHTGSVVYGFDLVSPAALKARAEFNVQTVEAMLRP
jgi:AcrR family transcriptional regulator